jgi:hypothetical protein
MLLLALATLALLPGLLVVRSPWHFVPALSLAFWTLSLWWPPLASASRGRVTLAALLVFVPLVALRLLPKHEVPPPPGWAPPPRQGPPPRPGRGSPRLATSASLLVAGAALALVLPAPLFPHGPGPAAAFHTAAARLLLWRDGLPRTLEPLLPLQPFGAHAPAVGALAADLARLSGAEPAQPVVAVLAASAALALLGLFALHATVFPVRAAALGALLGLAIAPWPAWLAAWGAIEALAALGFALPALALAIGHASRSSALAAGFLLGAALLAHPALAVLALATVGAAALARAPRERRSLLARRLGQVAAAALLFALPGLRPLAAALSPGEVAAAARALSPAGTAAFTFGLLLLALGPLLGSRLCGPPGGPWRRPAVAAGVLAAVLLVARLHAWVAAGQLPAAARASLGRAATTTGPLAVLCAPEPLRDWVPALAARAAGEPGPWIPAPYRDEWAARPRRPCVPLSSR